MDTAMIRKNIEQTLTLTSGRWAAWPSRKKFADIGVFMVS